MSGWLPVMTAWAGSGWGMVSLPLPGAQVILMPREGRLDNGVVIGSVYSNYTRPPATSPGELILTHQSGSSLHFTNSGFISITGDLHVTGNIYDAHGSLAQLRGIYDGHNHFINGGNPTSGPSQVA